MGAKAGEALAGGNFRQEDWPLADYEWNSLENGRADYSSCRPALLPILYLKLAAATQNEESRQHSKCERDHGGFRDGRYAKLGNVGLGEGGS